jgi:hypothetical protein
MLCYVGVTQIEFYNASFIFWNVYRTRLLRHMASELNLSMRSDGYVKVQDLLKLNMKTFANIPLKSHTVDDVREVRSSILFSSFSFLLVLSVKLFPSLLI